LHREEHRHLQFDRQGIERRLLEKLDDAAAAIELGLGFRVEVGAEFMVKQYLEGVIDTIEVIYPRFKNTLIQEAICQPVLPLDDLCQFIENLRKHGGTDAAGAADAREIHFEPNAKTVLDALLPFYVNRQIYQFVLLAKASEHSARMVAMKTAKDNATKILGDLTLEYNKARQAAITQEILEIAAASFAA